MLAVEICLLVDFHVVQVLFVNEIEKLVAEGFARFRENVIEACRAFFCQFHRAIERFLGRNLRRLQGHVFAFLVGNVATLPAPPCIPAHTLVFILYVIVVDKRLDIAVQILGNFERLAVKNHEGHQYFVCLQELADSLRRNPYGIILRETEHTAGNKREGDGLTTQFLRLIEGITVAICEREHFAGLAVIPLWPHGMDDVLRV